MKRLYVALTLLLMLLAASIWNGWWIHQLTEEVAAGLEEAMVLVGREDWEGAAQATRRAREHWQKHGSLLRVLLRHSDADQVLLSFAVMEANLQWKKADQYAAANAQLVCLLRLLGGMERPALHNVL